MQAENIGRWCWFPPARRARRRSDNYVTIAPAAPDSSTLEHDATIATDPMWNDILQALQQEFADLPDAAGVARVVLRLGLACLLGAAIGWERERNASSAGLRTHMLVCTGTALFVLVPQQSGMGSDEMSRVIQGVLSGVGFLGAGAVIKLSRDGEVRGLTTAAGIWTTAAIGVAVGLGREMTAILSTVIAVAILAALLGIEKRYLPRGERREPTSSPRDDDDDALSQRAPSSNAPVRDS